MNNFRSDNDDEDEQPCDDFQGLVKKDVEEVRDQSELISVRIKTMDETEK